MKISLPARFALIALVLSMLACRPVIAIGWSELSIFLGIFLLLLGPPLWRFWRWWEAFKRHEAERKKK